MSITLLFSCDITQNEKTSNDVNAGKFHDKLMAIVLATKVLALAIMGTSQKQVYPLAVNQRGMVKANEKCQHLVASLFIHNGKSQNLKHANM